MANEDGNSKSTNENPTGAWPFPSGMGRENDSASSDDLEAEGFAQNNPGAKWLANKAASKHLDAAKIAYTRG